MSVSTTNKKRLKALLPFLILSWMAHGWLTGAYHDCLLISDHSTCSGNIISEYWGGHANYNYEYTVNGHNYHGTSRRDYKSDKYGSAEIGDTVPVYYSTKYPEISLLYMPETYGTGLPWFLLVSVFWTFFLITIIKPKSGWSMDI